MLWLELAADGGRGEDGVGDVQIWISISTRQSRSGNYHNFFQFFFACQKEALAEAAAAKKMKINRN